MIPTSLVIMALLAVAILLCAIILCSAAEHQLQRRKRAGVKTIITTRQTTPIAR